MSNLKDLFESGQVFLILPNVADTPLFEQKPDTKGADVYDYDIHPEVPPGSASKLALGLQENFSHQFWHNVQEKDLDASEENIPGHIMKEMIRIAELAERKDADMISNLSPAPSPEPLEYKDDDYPTIIGPINLLTEGMTDSDLAQAPGFQQLLEADFVPGREITGGLNSAEAQLSRLLEADPDSINNPSYTPLSEFGLAIGTPKDTKDEKGNLIGDLAGLTGVASGVYLYVFNQHRFSKALNEGKMILDVDGKKRVVKLDAGPSKSIPAEKLEAEKSKFLKKAKAAKVVSKIGGAAGFIEGAITVARWSKGDVSTTKAVTEIAFVIAGLTGGPLGWVASTVYFIYEQDAEEAGGWLNLAEKMFTPETKPERFPELEELPLDGVDAWAKQGFILGKPT